MKENITIKEQLKKKYHKTEEVTNFKEMLYHLACNLSTQQSILKKVYLHKT